MRALELILAVALSAACSTPVRVWPVRSTPILRQGPPAFYPPVIRNVCMEGTQQVRVSLAADGSVSDAACVFFDGRALAKSGRVEEFRVSGGPPLLCDEALRAARRWRFDAPTRPDQQEGILTFIYQLLPMGAPDSELTTGFVAPSVLVVRSRTLKHCEDR